MAQHVGDNRSVHKVMTQRMWRQELHSIVRHDADTNNLSDKQTYMTNVKLTVVRMC